MLGRVSWQTFFGVVFAVFCFAGVVWQIQSGMENRIRKEIRDLNVGLTESLGTELTSEGEIIEQVKEKITEASEKSGRETSSLSQGITNLRNELKLLESSVTDLSTELQKLKSVPPPPPPIPHSSLCNYYKHLIGDNGVFVPRRAPVKIYDTILLLNEVEMLKIHMHELKESVDYFVITESNFTFTGKPKNRHFFDRRNEFSEFENKIIYVNCEFPSDLDMAEAKDPYGRGWDRERYSRACMQSGLKDAAPTDIVIVGDIDEIPHALTIKAFKDCEYRFTTDGRKFNDVQDFTIGYTQHRYHFNFHCESPNMKDWHGTVVTTAAFVAKYGAEATRGKRNSANVTQTFP